MNLAPETRINKKAIIAWKITAAIYGLAWFVVPALLIFVAYMESLGLALIISSSVPAIILYFITVFVFPSLRWKRWKYDLTENEIDLQRGFIIQKRTIVPINRIQHVDTSQGPIYRKLGLSSVKVSTAATTN
eukprot:TRINITY_DN25073_c0_g1_i1.p1 TRINITY_DN25073_c0_g1~~TRINITY_DN25073_c0_g1_i1.p1  ORF type:complete len:132 (-),score=8.67 TRINITY_DN25073_c0_g1_i1:20-415(-)